MKKFLGIIIALVLVLSVAAVASADDALKTGLYVGPTVSGSTSATENKAGTAYTDVELVAVTVDENGVIVDCIFDVIQAKIGFDATGALTQDVETTKFPSKMAKGDAYGMRPASSISKEWNEQLTALADYCKGKTVEEIKGIAVDENGKATDADLLASITMSISSELDHLIAAVESAENNGAMKGDKLFLVSTANMHSSKPATENKDGNAQVDATFAIATVNGETITSFFMNCVQTKVAFDLTGTITSDINAEIKTKMELGEAYGMRPASGIGKEWMEQAAAYNAYVTGKTVSAVCGMALEGDKPTDADLLAGCTMKIADMQELVAQLAE